jgi:hypothetical protein
MGVKYLKTHAVLFLFISPFLASANDFQVSKDIVRQRLDASEVSEILYQDVRGSGQKDAVVYYLRKNGDSNKGDYSAPFVGGVALITAENKLIWKHEEPCWTLGTGPLDGLVYLDQEKPDPPFIVLRLCQNASIGCSFHLFRWEGSTIGTIPVFGCIQGEVSRIETMPDGRKAIITSYRGQGVPTLLAYEKGKIYDHGPQYPGFYRTYIQKADEAVDSTVLKSSERLWALGEGMQAAFFAKLDREGMKFCRKILELNKAQNTNGRVGSDNREACAYMGRFFMDLGDRDQAMNEFMASAKAYGFKPFGGEAGMYNELAHYYLARMNFRKAMEAYEKERPVLEQEDLGRHDHLFIGRLEQDLKSAKEQWALFEDATN